MGETPRCGEVQYIESEVLGGTLKIFMALPHHPIDLLPDIRVG